MSDIKLFRTNADEVTQLEGHSVALEKSFSTVCSSTSSFIVMVSSIPVMMEVLSVEVARVKEAKEDKVLTER